MARATFKSGERVSYRSPRGLIYGSVAYEYRGGEQLCFAPDPGTTYGGGPLGRTIDVRTALCERTDAPPTAVAL